VHKFREFIGVFLVKIFTIKSKILGAVSRFPLLSFALILRAKGHPLQSGLFLLKKKQNPTFASPQIEDSPNTAYKY